MICMPLLVTFTAVTGVAGICCFHIHIMKKKFFNVKHRNMRFENSNFSWPSDSEGVMKETDFMQPQVPNFYFFHSGMEFLKVIIEH